MSVMCRRLNEAEQETALVFQMQDSSSQAAFMSSCRTGRETTMSELSPEEVVMIICGRKQSEESSETLSNLPAVESPNDHKQTSDTLEIAAAAKTKHLSCATKLLHFQFWKTSSHAD